MPKIQWERLPTEKWAHLGDRAKERQIFEADLFELSKAQDVAGQTPRASGCDGWLAAHFDRSTTG